MEEEVRSLRAEVQRLSRTVRQLQERLEDMSQLVMMNVMNASSTSAAASASAAPGAGAGGPDVVVNGTVQRRKQEIVRVQQMQQQQRHQQMLQRVGPAGEGRAGKRLTLAQRREQQLQRQKLQKQQQLQAVQEGEQPQQPQPQHQQGGAPPLARAQSSDASETALRKLTLQRRQSESAVSSSLVSPSFKENLAFWQQVGGGVGNGDGDRSTTGAHRPRRHSTSELIFPGAGTHLSGSTVAPFSSPGAGASRAAPRGHPSWTDDDGARGPRRTASKAQTPPPQGTGSFPLPGGEEDDATWRQRSRSMPQAGGLSCDNSSTTTTTAAATATPPMDGNRDDDTDGTADLAASALAALGDGLGTDLTLENINGHNTATTAMEASGEGERAGNPLPDRRRRHRRAHGGGSASSTSSFGSTGSSVDLSHTNGEGEGEGDGSNGHGSNGHGSNGHGSKGKRSHRRIVSNTFESRLSFWEVKKAATQSEQGAVQSLQATGAAASTAAMATDPATLDMDALAQQAAESLDFSGLSGGDTASSTPAHDRAAAPTGRRRRGPTSHYQPRTRKAMARGQEQQQAAEKEAAEAAEAEAAETSVSNGGEDGGEGQEDAAPFVDGDTLLRVEHRADQPTDDGYLESIFGKSAARRISAREKRRSRRLAAKNQSATLAGAGSSEETPTATGQSTEQSAQAIVPESEPSEASTAQVKGAQTEVTDLDTGSKYGSGSGSDAGPGPASAPSATTAPTAAPKFHVETTRAPQTLVGHTQPVVRVAIAADDQAVFSSSGAELRVWNVNTGSCRILRGHSEPITALLARPRPDRFLSACSGGEMRLWNVDDETSEVLTDDQGLIMDLAQTVGNGRLIAWTTGSPDTRAKVFDPSSGTVMADIESPHGEYAAHSVQLTELYILTGGGDGLVKLWALGRGPAAFSGQLVRTLAAHDGLVLGLAVDMCCKYVVSSSSNDNVVRCWDMESGRCVQSVQADEVAGDVCVSLPLVAIASPTCTERKGESRGLARRRRSSKKRSLFLVWGAGAAGAVSNVVIDDLTAPNPPLFVEAASSATDGRCQASVLLEDAEGEARRPLRRRRSVTEMEAGRATTVAVSSDSSMIVTGNDEGTIRIWHTNLSDEDGDIDSDEANMY